MSYKQRPKHFDIADAIRAKQLSATKRGIAKVQRLRKEERDKKFWLALDRLAGRQS